MPSRAGARLEEVPTAASAPQWAVTGSRVGLLSSGLCMAIAAQRVVLGQCTSKNAAVNVIPAGAMAKLYLTQDRLYATWHLSGGDLIASRSGAGSQAEFILPAAADARPPRS